MHRAVSVILVAENHQQGSRQGQLPVRIVQPSDVLRPAQVGRH